MPQECPVLSIWILIGGIDLSAWFSPFGENDQDLSSSLRSSFFLRDLKSVSNFYT